jgi:manganese transport protein
MIMNPTDTHAITHTKHSVPVDAQTRGWKRFAAFFGPAYLVSVGYMDPGNWATDIEGGARFGYALIWVLLMSNAMAILLQTLSARLGIATGRDLAQACRDNYPPVVAYALWVLAEIAIAACDLAEVLGTAIGINLLFGIPVFWGVVIAGFDTMLLLAIQNLGVRKFEAFVIALVALIGGCFLVELILSKPDMAGVVSGVAPRLPDGALYVAIGIIGATVMPHNLYLHSALVQTRSFEQTPDGKRSAMKYNLIDSVVALNAALFVNAAILILAAATFFKHGVAVNELQQAHQLLSPMVGTTLAGVLFAVALLAAGQSSTLTGTLAGQVVMEGFLHFKIRPFLRRLVTRLIAIVPAMFVLMTTGDKGMYGLLIFSQVVLSLQLAFAIVPLIHFTSNKRLMGEFASKPLVQVLAWLVALVIIALNVKLVWEFTGNLLGSTSSVLTQTLAQILLYAALAVLVPLLLYITFAPFLSFVPLASFKPLASLTSRRNRTTRTNTSSNADSGEKLSERFGEGFGERFAAEAVTAPRFERIGVTVALSQSDGKVLQHACQLARQHDAVLCVFHVVEGAGGIVYGREAFDAEAREDERALKQLCDSLAEHGIRAEGHLGFGSVPKAIVRFVREQHVGMLVMGGHGHRGLSDIIFGATISPVRHEITIPLVIVR